MTAAAVVPPLVRLKAIRVERGGAKILRGVDWTIRPGEHWVVMGPNGCGKTSLLRVLTGYLTPTSGLLETLPERGLDAEGWFDLRKHIGWVSASLAARIEDNQTALEIIVSGPLGMLNHWGKLSAAEIRRGEAMLRRVRALPLRDRPWGEFSQGERQRVLLGRALMSQLKLLVLDEPCAGLDPVAREHFLGFLDSLARRRRSPGIILVTHHVEEITPAFTHALLMHKGKAVASGPRATTLNEPALAATFGAPVRLCKSPGGRLRLEVATDAATRVF
jgi:iron complex transport system ATP-binding protein